MTQVPASLADFAKRIFLHEAGGDQRAQDFAAAMERVCEALDTRLTPLLSATGMNALLGRAVTLAGREYSFLTAIGPVTSCSLDGLRQAVDGRDPAEAADALSAILANFLWLLVTFIGKDLGLRKVHEAWPDVPFTSPAPSEKAPR